MFLWAQLTMGIQGLLPVRLHLGSESGCMWKVVALLFLVQYCWRCWWPIFYLTFSLILKPALLSSFYPRQLVTKVWIKWLRPMLPFRKHSNQVAFFNLSLPFFVLNPMGCGWKPEWKQLAWERHSAWLFFKQSRVHYKADKAQHGLFLSQLMTI